MTKVIAVMVTPDERMQVVYEAADYQATSVMRDTDACLDELAADTRAGLKETPRFKARMRVVLAVLQRVLLGMIDNDKEAARAGYHLHNAKLENYGLMGVLWGPGGMPGSAFASLYRLFLTLASWRVVALDWGMFVRLSDFKASKSWWCAFLMLLNITPDHISAGETWEDVRAQLDAGTAPTTWGRRRRCTCWAW
jgi:hypothetical protein